MSDGSTRLEYQKPRKLSRIRLADRRVRQIVVTVILVIAAYLTWTNGFGDWAISRSQFAYRSYRCENHTPRTDMPVFSTEPGGIQKIQTSARYGWSFNKIWFGPDCPDYEGIRKFIPGDTSFLFNPSDMLFVHRRSQPNGESRLVAITVEGGPWSASYPGATSTGGPVRGGQFVDYAGIESQVLIPEKTTYKWANRWANHRRIVQLILPRGCALTIEDGSPDQTDATRFTIPYTLGTQRGTMAGKLQPDDSILLQVRTGPLVLFLPDAPYVPIQRAPK